MRLVVFGATGGTGLCVAQQAIAAGHAVTAFARDPAGIPAGLGEGLAVVQGDVLDRAQVATAIRGANVVLSCLGTRPWRHIDICSQGTRVIAAAMDEVGVRRLIAMSSLGVGDSKIGGVVGALSSAVLGRAFRDKDAMETELAATALDWIVVRPARLTSGAGLACRAADDGSLTGGKVTRAATAAFMLAQLESDRWLRRRPVLAQ